MVVSVKAETSPSVAAIFKVLVNMALLLSAA
jgi:hypothetical protein